MALTMTTWFWNSTIIQLKLLSRFKAWILLTSFWCLWHLIIWVYETRLLTVRAAQKIPCCTHLDSSFVKPKWWFSPWALLYMHHLGAEIEHGIPISLTIKLQIFHSPNITVFFLIVKYRLSYSVNCKCLLNLERKKKKNKKYIGAIGF